MPNSTPTDRQLAQVALDKIKRGDVPSKNERRALERVKIAQREEMTETILQELPKRTYQAMAQRQVKVINEQAARYGVPCDGVTINLFKVVRWLHDMLATHGNRLVADPDEDPLLAGANSPMLEKCRHEKWLLLQMERRQKESNLLDRSMLHECHVRIASILRKCGDRMERQFGQEPADMLREALRDCSSQISKFLDQKESDTHGDKNQKSGGQQHSGSGPGRRQPAKDQRAAGQGSAGITEAIR